MKGLTIVCCLIISFLIISGLANRQLAFAENDKLGSQAQTLESVAAPKEFLQTDNNVAGSLEIQFFGPDFISKTDHPKFVIKNSSNFDRKEADIELANNPLTYELPVLIKNLTPGEYYIGVRTPPRIYVDPVYKIPTPIVEKLAWDGSIFEGYIVNSKASAMYIQRWYRTIIEIGKISLVTALFFRPKENINLQLSNSAKHTPKYKVNIKPDKNKDTFGIDLLMIPELLSRTGKVFIPRDFLLDVSVSKFDSIWYLPNVNSGLVKAFGHKEIIDKPKQSLPTANSTVKDIEHRSTDFELLKLLSPKNVSGKTKTLLPPFEFQIDGQNEVRIKNPNQYAVTVGLRSGKGGKNFRVNSNGVASVFAPNGKFEIYFVYSDKPDALFQGDSFILDNKGVEIQLVKVVGGNYGIRRVK